MEITGTDADLSAKSNPLWTCVGREEVEGRYRYTFKATCDDGAGDLETQKEAWESHQKINETLFPAEAPSAGYMRFLDVNVCCNSHISHFAR